MFNYDKLSYFQEFVQIFFWIKLEQTFHVIFLSFFFIIYCRYFFLINCDHVYVVSYVIELNSFHFLFVCSKKKKKKPIVHIILGLCNFFNFFLLKIDLILVYIYIINTQNFLVIIMMQKKGPILRNTIELDLHNNKANRNNNY